MENKLTVQNNYSLSDLEIMSKKAAQSNFLGTRNDNEVFTLLMLAQSEGKNPIQASMDYSIIQGKPALKSQATLVRFQKAGGKVTYLKRDDTECTIKFEHPQAGELTVSWTMETAQKAGLNLNKDNWKKYPRQMLAARCIAEGIRALYPACLEGLYLVEEVQDFDTPNKQKQNNNIVDIEASSIDNSVYDIETNTYSNEDVSYIEKNDCWVTKNGKYTNDITGNACKGDEILCLYKNKYLEAIIIEDEYKKIGDNIIHYFHLKDIKGNCFKAKVSEIYQTFTYSKEFDKKDRKKRLEEKYTKRKIAEGKISKTNDTYKIGNSIKCDAISEDTNEEAIVGYSIVPNGKNKGKKWEELDITSLANAVKYYASQGDREQYIEYVEKVLNEKLSICPVGISKGCKWEELSTEKLESYYNDYKSGKLIGYADEYASYIEKILIKRQSKQSEFKGANNIQVNEDEDPFSDTRDDEWDKDINGNPFDAEDNRSLDELIAEQEKNNLNQIDDDKKFKLEN
ncbi:hypothetical protein [uncultured Brachyspira sp.]|uniref:hypothetical protein n=1 Tax=uncultured Brachyspira sp. TaxID=221953 RepID=UPI0025F4AB90|nr:hypothetical protein [uncultured Brachyspira sp.]